MQSLFFSSTRFHECPQIAHDGWKNLNLLGRGAKLEFTLTDNKVFSPQLFRSCDVKDRERGTQGWGWGLEVVQRPEWEERACRMSGEVKIDTQRGHLGAG